MPPYHMSYIIDWWTSRLVPLLPTINSAAISMTVQAVCAELTPVQSLIATSSLFKDTLSSFKNRNAFQGSMVAYICLNPSTWQREAEGVSEFVASLIYTASSRPAKATEGDPKEENLTKPNKLLSDQDPLHTTASCTWDYRMVIPVLTEPSTEQSRMSLSQQIQFLSNMWTKQTVEIWSWFIISVGCDVVTQVQGHQQKAHLKWENPRLRKVDAWNCLPTDKQGTGRWKTNKNFRRNYKSSVKGLWSSAWLWRQTLRFRKEKLCPCVFWRRVARPTILRTAVPWYCGYSRWFS